MRGNFYSTPAVAYGRVYIGNTDGRMYSFSANSGKLAWSKSTGGYVYASPAVAQVPGGRPLVYAGSYSGRFYALDARSGAVRWTRGGNGRISGGATVIGDIVYYADLGNRRTIGLGARTGRKVFEHERGSYNPVVSDGETIFLTGYHVLYALRPLSAATKKARAKSARDRAQRRRTDRADLQPARARGPPWQAGREAALLPPLHRAPPGAAPQESARGMRAAARRLHRGRKGAKRRSYERCVDRRHAHRRA